MIKKFNEFINESNTDRNLISLVPDNTIVLNRYKISYNPKEYHNITYDIIEIKTNELIGNIHFDSEDVGIDYQEEEIIKIYGKTPVNGYYYRILGFRFKESYERIAYKIIENFIEIAIKRVGNKAGFVYNEYDDSNEPRERYLDVIFDKLTVRNKKVSKVIIKDDYYGGDETSDYIIS
jgi:hypothetical protein